MENIFLITIISLCLWAITDRHVPTGVIITSGLMLISCACFAALDGSNYIHRAMKVMVAGATLVGLGIFWRLVGCHFWSDVMLRWPLMQILVRSAGTDRH